MFSTRGPKHERSNNVMKRLSRGFVRLSICAVCLLGMTIILPAPLAAQSPLVRIIESGRVPAERLGPLVKTLCQRGSADDLAFVLKKTTAADGFSGQLQLTAISGLADAATDRKVHPSGDLAAIATLLDADRNQEADPAIRTTAIRLTGLWRVAAAAQSLRAIVLDDQEKLATRSAAASALTSIGGDAARATIDKLITADQPLATQLLGIAALTKIDLDTAATTAADVLVGAKSDFAPAGLLNAFMGVKAGGSKLAAALNQRPPAADVAKILLRQMYSVGQSDAALDTVLSKIAGIADVKPPTAAEIQQLVADVAAHGNPARGEAIFRSADVGCMKCHSVSKAGGQVGPDLSAVGGTSPAEYLVKSILLPDEAIKEQYRTLKILTEDGEVILGIVLEDNDEHVILKTLNGETVTILRDDIDPDGTSKGKSLMPQGLTKFLTRDEMVDLVRFLSELGKPGEYAVRSKPTIQRWRVLESVPTALVSDVPSVELLQSKILDAADDAWIAAYGKVAGALPLDELVADKRNEVLFLQGHIDVTSAGTITLGLDSAAGITAWIDTTRINNPKPGPFNLTEGRHAITLRVDLQARKSRELTVTVDKPNGSTAELTVVGGR